MKGYGGRSDRRPDGLVWRGLLAWWERCRRSVGAVTDAEFASVGGGDGHALTGEYGTIAGGRSNQVTGAYGAVLGGYGAVARLHGEHAQAGGCIAAAGDAQTAVFHLFRSVTDSGAAAWYRLYLDGSTKECALPDNTAWSLYGVVVGKRKSANIAGGYRLYATARRGTGAASAALVYATTISMGADAGMPATTPRLVADTTLGGIGLEVRSNGTASQVIHWSARLMVAQVAD